MRTKTLLLTAALTAAGIATAKAQVYSVNAVGYVNTPLIKGYNLISNPLDNKAANGNQIKSLFASLPGGSQVFRFTGTGFQLAEINPITGEVEGPAATAVVEPGDGVFVFIPNDAPANVTVTFVGEVKTGSLSTPIPAGYSIKSSQVPQAGAATGVLGFPAADNDQIFRFNESTQKYETFGFTTLLGWDPSDPTIEVGEAFFVNNLGAAKNWTRTFNINQ